jgi:hypothetical protein
MKIFTWVSSIMLGLFLLASAGFGYMEIFTHNHDFNDASALSFALAMGVGIIQFIVSVTFLD